LEGAVAEPETVCAVRRDDAGYPENLRHICDAPECLFVKGSVLPRDRVAVAVVGTRSPTPVGKVIAFEIARDLAGAGATVVSGLALGIDTQAHLGALAAGGRTIACLGTGVDVVYPRRNASLMRDIAARGSLVSEYPAGTAPLGWHFPKRNRIISGISLGVVVVEAGEKSGALNTAGWALGQGRPVMAVPGSPRSRTSAGTNRLIQEGAYLVTSAEDVLSFLRRENEYVPELPKEGRTRTPDLTLEEGALLAAIRGNALTADQLAERFPLFTPGKLAAVLSTLELKGMARKIAGGKYLAKT
jgi:DNA processing protein